MTPPSGESPPRPLDKAEERRERDWCSPKRGSKACGGCGCCIRYQRLFATLDAARALLAERTREVEEARRIATSEADMASTNAPWLIERLRARFAGEDRARAEAAETALAEARAGAQERDAEARRKGMEIAEDLIRARAEKFDNGPMRLGMERAANEVLRARGGPANG